VQNYRGGNNRQRQGRQPVTLLGLDAVLQHEPQVNKDPMPRTPNQLISTCCDGSEREPISASPTRLAGDRSGRFAELLYASHANDERK
jgi:hypothetical protein